ncbi:hypothetical protein GCM10022215_19230 [Nocardioides fonticola]|uniref:Putative Flp pilus-assembly TadG-like N-terminal domain-containing protein n=1 Tax=Nocardioides fonticola TaxID=450363 RepID=A0ABP7XIC3_9ACTN
MRRDERGTITPLIIGFAVVIILGIVLVVDSTAAYLQRQSLDNLADGAALHAADQGAAGLAYSEGVAGEALPVDAGSARAAVTDYLRRIGAFRDHPDLRVEVQVDATSVTVSLDAPADLPLTMPGAPSSTRVRATGAAVTTVDP